MPEKTTGFLKPEQLAPIRNLSMRAKFIVEGMITGQHKSPYHGFSAEFLEYRSYIEGESTRRIDWRKFAKTERTVVRLYEDETNLYARILVDKSASMKFASNKNGMSKFEYARTLAASLAWILIRQRDAVGLALFDSQIRASVPPRSTNLQLKTVLAHLDGAQPEHETACGNAINALAATIKKRGMTVLISDMLDDIDALRTGLKHLRFKKQDVLLFWVLDPLELSFEQQGHLHLHDLESHTQLTIDSSTAAHFYRQEFSRHRDALLRTCKDLQIDCEIMQTSEPFEKALLRALDKRRRLY
ncbi:MAG: DUF58 domain-containing protein [Chitinivibrionales bacterium]|nr:DUF58 domain-containing protein [Chitinivibrionales bacterium]